MHNHHYHSHTNNVLDRIRTLQSIVNSSQSASTTTTTTSNTTAPVGFTAARWSLALQSFNERFHLRRRREIDEAQLVEANEETFLVPFGPEWELQEAMRELDVILEQK